MLNRKNDLIPWLIVSSQLWGDSSACPCWYANHRRTTTNVWMESSQVGANLNKRASHIHPFTSTWCDCKCHRYLLPLISPFYPFSCHLTQFHGVDAESKNSIAEHVCWDYHLVSVGDVGQLKGSISSNIVIPICSAFSPETQLWGLCQAMPWAALWLFMLSPCFQKICLVCFLPFFWIMF